MIITKINRLATYTGVNPHFEKLISFLKTVKAKYTKKQLDNYLSLLRYDVSLMQTSKRDLIGFSDIVIDRVTGEILEHSPDNWLFSVLPFPYQNKQQESPIHAITPIIRQNRRPNGRLLIRTRNLPSQRQRHTRRPAKQRHKRTPVRSGRNRTCRAAQTRFSGCLQPAARHIW